MANSTVTASASCPNLEGWTSHGVSGGKGNGMRSPARQASWLNGAERIWNAVNPSAIVIGADGVESSPATVVIVKFTAPAIWSRAGAGDAYVVRTSLP